MKTQIFWFSSTGNSLCVARDIAQAIGGEVELTAIPQALKAPVPVTAQSLGIVFPVYIWGLPALVRRFVEQLDIPTSMVPARGHRVRPNHRRPSSLSSPRVFSG